MAEPTVITLVDHGLNSEMWDGIDMATRIVLAGDLAREEVINRLEIIAERKDGNIIVTASYGEDEG